MLHFLHTCPPPATCSAQPSNEAELCNAGIGADFGENGVAKNHKGTPWEVSAGHLLPGCSARLSNVAPLLAQLCTVLLQPSLRRRAPYVHPCMGEYCL